MLKVDRVLSVSQNLVAVPSSCFPWSEVVCGSHSHYYCHTWQRYCLLVSTEVHWEVTSSR